MLLRAAKLLLSLILTLKVAHCLPANRIALGQLGVLSLCVSFLIFSFFFVLLPSRLLSLSLFFSRCHSRALSFIPRHRVFVFLFYSILSQFVFFYANPSPHTFISSLPHHFVTHVFLVTLRLSLSHTVGSLVLSLF